MDRVECVVVGAGVVGLAIARALAGAGREVLLVECNGGIGEETSSRNNEVVHAGFLYASHSLKERLCLRGRTLLLTYCEARGIGHRLLGKLMPATDDAELALLRNYVRRAAEIGIADVRLLDAGAAREIEPQLECLGALYSPASGIVDSHALMLALQADAEAAGAVLATRSQVMHASVGDDGRFVLEVLSASEGGVALGCDVLVNAAGLGALPLAQSLGLGPSPPKIHFAKGSFFGYRGVAPFRHLVVPVGATLGAGAAFTLDLAGQGRFGPDLSWVEQKDYRIEPEKAASFAAAIRRYWPQLDEQRLVPGYAGIRPRASGPGEPPADWVIQGPSTHGVDGLLQLFGIDTPGLTACLAIAEAVAGELATVASPAPRLERNLHAH